MPPSDPAQILTALVTRGWETLRIHLDPDCCIAAARLAVDLFQEYGVHVAPIVCTVTGFNAPAARALVEGRPPEAEPDAQIVDIDTREDDPEKFAGHVALVGKMAGKDIFLDLSAPQFHRPDKGILVERPVLLHLRPTRAAWEVTIGLSEGGLLRYRSHVNDSWRKAPAWRLPSSAHERRHGAALDDLRRLVRGEPIVGFKVCACGKHFTLDDWRALAFVGVHKDDVEAFEMRNCPCGSTLSVPIPLYMADTWEVSNG